MAIWNEYFSEAVFIMICFWTPPLFFLNVLIFHYLNKLYAKSCASYDMGHITLLTKLPYVIGRIFSYIVEGEKGFRVKSFPEQKKIILLLLL